DDEQVNAIARHMPEREQLAVLLAGWMALRIGEVLGLQRRDLRTVNGQRWLRVARQVQSRGQGVQYSTPKSKAGVRDLPVLSILEDALSDHLARFVDEADTAPLFSRPMQPAVPVAPNTLRTHFGRAIA